MNQSILLRAGVLQRYGKIDQESSQVFLSGHLVIDCSDMESSFLQNAASSFIVRTSQWYIHSHCSMNAVPLHNVTSIFCSLACKHHIHAQFDIIAELKHKIIR